MVSVWKLEHIFRTAASLDGVSAAAGLTTQVVYDDHLSDGVRPDGTYNVSIAAVLAQLAEPPGAGGAGIAGSASR